MYLHVFYFVFNFTFDIFAIKNNRTRQKNNKEPLKYVKLKIIFQWPINEYLQFKSTE